MKSRKLLIGFFVASLMCGTHVASAQIGAKSQNRAIVEIGPDNLSGRVRSIVVDEADPSHTTIYAGSVAGGLFKKVGSGAWEYIPYIVDGREISLPISHMVQLPDNTLLIATGEGFCDNHDKVGDRITLKGYGVFHFNPADNSFTLLEGTDPAKNPDWSIVNRLAYLHRNSHLYIYAATGAGLYSMATSATNPNWNVNPIKEADGEFQSLVVLTADNMLYASATGKLYKVGNITASSEAVDVTNTNAAFATSSRIELAGLTAHKFDSTLGAYEHTTYLYAVVTNEAGLLDGVYLTHDQQNWTLLNPATMTPFTAKNPGTFNSAIAIDPTNYKRIFVGGESVWEGNGFVENARYVWSRSSMSEESLNNGNYMYATLSNPTFVHSGIHQIVPTLENRDGVSSWVYYIATDGGVFVNRTNNFQISTFSQENQGLNTVQYNSIAVSPDGSIVGGAIDNSCPFIQSRNAHNGTTQNKSAMVLWNGNGGGVAASMFQQVQPDSRRGLFFSSESGRFQVAGISGMEGMASFARSYADYADYTNTQTWNIAQAFLSNAVKDANPVPAMYLWETLDNTESKWNDEITFHLDTMGVYFHDSVETPLKGNTVIEPGDEVIVPSPAHFNYPFRYKFDTTFTARDMMTHTVHNPISSRMLINAREGSGKGCVYFTFTPTDYRKVWDAEMATADPKSVMRWAKLFTSVDGQSVGAIAMNRIGNAAFINVIDDTTGNSYLFVCTRIDSANANDLTRAVVQLNYANYYEGMNRVTLYDSVYNTDGNWFKRHVSSIAVDPRAGTDNILLTFDGEGADGEPNLLLIENASDAKNRKLTPISVTNAETGMTAADPVFCALFECTTGTVFVGTAKGVYKTTTSSLSESSTWEEHGNFYGVPVTSIVQQTNNLKRERFYTHAGIDTTLYIFAKTKYPYAIYYGTYGRGVYMDSTYVTDYTNDIIDTSDFAGITNVSRGENRISIYPNPAQDFATVDIAMSNAANAVVKVYDISGKMVMTERLGVLTEGTHQHKLDCTKLNKGMYLVNISFGKESAATSKLIVR